MLINPYRFGGGVPASYAKWSLKGDATTLSNNDLTAARSGGGSTWNTVLADRDITEKSYWEMYVTWPATGERHVMGIANAAAPLSSASQRIGLSTPSTTWGAGVGGPNNITRFSGAFSNRADSATGVLVAYMFAFDPSTLSFWMGESTLGWWGSTPPAGSTYVMTAGIYRPALSLNSAFAESITANFGSDPFVGVVPTGFAAGIT